MFQKYPPKNISTFLTDLLDRHLKLFGVWVFINAMLDWKLEQKSFRKTLL